MTEQPANQSPVWVFVHDNRGRLPPQKSPVIVMFRIRKAGRVVGIPGVCCVVEDVFSPGVLEWIRLDSDNNKAQPYAWLDLGPIADNWNEQFLHNLAKLGELPL